MQDTESNVLVLVLNVSQVEHFASMFRTTLNRRDQERSTSGVFYILLYL